MNLRASGDFRPGPVAFILEQVAPRAIAAVTKATGTVAVTAQGLAPVLSGDLANSIEATVELIGTTVQGAVEATAPYAAFVEFGTGLTGSASPHGELPTEGVPYTGAWVYDFRGRGWKGMAAQPFLRPALDMNFNAIMGAFAEEGFVV